MLEDLECYIKLNNDLGVRVKYNPEHYGGVYYGTGSAKNYFIDMLFSAGTDKNSMITATGNTTVELIANKDGILLVGSSGTIWKISKD